MSSTPFRSVGQQRRESFVRSDLRAVDRTKQLQAHADSQQRALDAYQKGLLRANEFEAQNARTNSQVEINNTRLQQSNEITNAQIEAKNNQIVGQQALDSQRLAMQFDKQIRDMQNAQEIVRNQLSLQFMSQESKALSSFGESFLKLSSTLAENQIKQINEENQAAREESRMRELLDLNGAGALEKINQLQRFNAGADLDAQANAMENEGNLRDATNLRSHNGWAMYGALEGKAIKSALGLERRMQEAISRALEDGSLAYGNPNFERDLHILLNKEIRGSLSSDDLLNVPTPILAEYFQPALLKAVQSVTQKHFSDNNKLTKDKGISRAISELQVGAASERFAEDLPLLASSVVMKDPLNASKNLTRAAKLVGETTNSLQPLQEFRDFLLGSDLGKEYGVEALIEVEKQIDSFRDTTAKALKKELKDKAEMLVFNFKRQALTLSDPSELSAIRDEALQELATFPDEIQAPLFEKILDTDISDIVVIKQRNDESMLGVSPFALADHIRDNLLTVPQTPEEYKRLSQLADSYDKMTVNREEVDRVITQLNSEIEAQIPEVDKRVDQLQKILTGESSGSDMLRAAEFRKEEVLDFVKNYYATDPNPTPDGLRKAIKEIHPDLFESIKAREFDTFNEERLNNDIKFGSYKRSRQALVSGETALTTIPGGKRSGVSYLNAETNANAVRGLLGQLDADTGIFLTAEELQRFSAQWEIGVIDEKLDRLSDLADVSPRQFLAAQAEFYPSTGTLERREYPSPQGEKSTKVTYKYAFDFARDEFGLSRKGATVIANAMMEESSGITTEVHDQGTGYGLFGHRLDRRTNLENFAASMKRDKSDPIAQLTFALTELRDDYPHLFLILQSSNAKDDQYFEVMRKWLRFHHSLYDKRRNSLYDALKGLN